MSIFRCAMLLPLIFCVALTALSQEKELTDYQEIAHKIVATSAQVKPGEKVVVSGGTHTVAWMEALAMECNNVGASVITILESNRVRHNFLMNAPEDYLSEPGFLPDIVKSADVYIGLPITEENDIAFDGVPPTRLKKAFAGYRAFDKAVKESKVRSVLILLPDASAAASAHMDFTSFKRLQLDALNVDYHRMAERGGRLAGLLRKARTIKITSANGASLVLSPEGSSLSVYTGVPSPGPTSDNRDAFLPSGYLTFSPIEASAKGKVAASRDTCHDEPLLGAEYEFDHGKIANFRAERNADCFTQLLKDVAGTKDMLRSISIGLNPALKVNDDSPDTTTYTDAAGMVFISLGSLYSSGDPMDSPVSWSIPVTHATLEIDGKIVIKDGSILE